jgi:FixJ family two-component response regulator
VSSSSDRILLVDDEPAVRRSLSRLLRAAGFVPVEFGSPEEFLRDLRADAAGCAIFDVSMPGLDGLELQRVIASRGISLPIVFLTGRGDIPQSVRAMKEGAVDFLTKPVDGEVLLDAVRQALERGRATRDARAAVAAIQGRFETLTEREREVFDGVLAGRLNKQIAAGIGISEKTVKVHRGRMMEKMAADSVAELVHLAARAGLRPG